MQTSPPMVSGVGTQRLRAGAPLPKDQFAEIRQKTVFECSKWDFQSRDHCVLADFPVFISESDWQFLARSSEAMHRELICVEQELLGRPELQNELGLPRPVLNTLGRKNNDNRDTLGFARIMRFDFHWTTEGWRVSEVNADVPGGFIEAGGFTEYVAASQPNTITAGNPAVAYAKSIQTYVGKWANLALVHATSHSDDRQVMEYLSGIFTQLGMNSFMVSPDHVSWSNGIARFNCKFASGRPDALIRFFPGEWLPDAVPERQWIPYFSNCWTPLSNPGSALLLQSKRLPLVWAKLNCTASTLQSMFPVSKDVRVIQKSDFDGWVFKPALGRVGEDVGIKGVSSEPEWSKIIRDALRKPGNWIAQRRFHIEPLETEYGPRFPCVGVFTIDGRAEGIYGRLSSSALIDDRAQDVAILISSVEVGN
jgi:glutathionylspermidine synthase